MGHKHKSVATKDLEDRYLIRPVHPDKRVQKQSLAVRKKVHELAVTLKELLPECRERGETFEALDDVLRLAHFSIVSSVPGFKPAAPEPRETHEAPEHLKVTPEQQATPKPVALAPPGIHVTHLTPKQTAGSMVAVPPIHPEKNDDNAGV